MSKITFSKLTSSLGLKLKKDVARIKILDKADLEILQYLPIEEKAKMIEFIVDGGLDEATGCFSPLRLEVYFGIAICKWYGGITFTDKQLHDIGKTYDILECNGIIDRLLCSIPSGEAEFIKDLVNDTVKDIARYNSSAAGIIQQMSSNTDGLDNQLNKIMESIRNGEGLETLKVIEDVVGRD